MKKILLITVGLSFLGLAGCSQLKYAQCIARDNTSRPCNW